MAFRWRYQGWDKSCKCLRFPYVPWNIWNQLWEWNRMMVHSGIQLFHTCFSIVFLHITWVLVSVSYWSPVPRTWAGWKTQEHMNQTTEAVFLTSIFIGLLWRCSFNMLMHVTLANSNMKGLYSISSYGDWSHPFMSQEMPTTECFRAKKWFAMVCPCLSKNCIPQFQYIPIIHSLFHH